MLEPDVGHLRTFPDYRAHARPPHLAVKRFPPPPVLHVGARGKGLIARAGDDDDIHVRIVLEAEENAAYVLLVVLVPVGRGGKGIIGFGLVDGERGYLFLFLYLEPGHGNPAVNLEPGIVLAQHVFLLHFF